MVGNGGILNGSRQGPNIDAHDYVFRCVEQGSGRLAPDRTRGHLPLGLARAGQDSTEGLISWRVPGREEET